MRRFATIVLLTMLAASASAQTTGNLSSEVQPGARVRASAPGVGTVSGRVVAVQGDSLRVARDHSADTVRFAASQLTSLELSVGRHKRRGRGAAIGFLGGAALGAALGAATYQKPDCSGAAYFCDVGRGADIFVGATLLGAVGAVTGAIVGGGTEDTWKPVSLARRASMQIGVPRSTGRLSVGASLRL